MAEKTYREKHYAKLTPGKSVRMLRELHDMTQAELAKRAGLTQGTVSAIESGAKAVGIERAKRLAKALRVHPAVIAFPDWPTDQATTTSRDRDSTPA